eukprot:m.37298 g.37298  ORF g.37298 m.37298 type:complete len:116 (-) comp44961_c0_seq8:27-374(-)
MNPRFISQGWLCRRSTRTARQTGKKTASVSVASTNLPTTHQRHPMHLRLPSRTITTTTTTIIITTMRVPMLMIQPTAKTPHNLCLQIQSLPPRHEHFLEPISRFALLCDAIGFVR